MGDLAFLCSCDTTLEGLRLWAHECSPGIPRNFEDQETVEFADVLGAIAEDLHLTRCDQVCFTGTEGDQAEQHDQGTTDEVLGNQDLEQRKDVLEEADREAGLLEQIPLLGHPESEKRTSCILASSSSPSSRCNQTITSKLATSKSRSSRADATCCPCSTRLYQRCRDLSMSGMRQHKAETSNTQSITTST